MGSLRLRNGLEEQAGSRVHAARPVTDVPLLNGVVETEGTGRPLIAHAELGLTQPVVHELGAHAVGMTVRNAGKCEIAPSTAKVEKYRTRMKAAFEEYRMERSLRTRRAYRELIWRIKFLTGNTRLSNSKSRAATGIYYNNSIATDLTSFGQLDQELKALIGTLHSGSLQKKLKKLKFTTGFEQRRYHHFSARELQTIVRAWKYA